MLRGATLVSLFPQAISFVCTYNIPQIMITLSLRQSLLGQFPFGLRLPGPFNPSSGTSFHLIWLSVSLR